jgi:hypothetical protein
MLVAALVLALGSGAAFADPKPPGKVGEPQQAGEASSDWLNLSPWDAIIQKVCQFAGRAAMECDNDGTASDFVPNPDEAVPVEGIVESMESVGDKLGGGVTMVSGRGTDYLREHYPNQNVDGGYGMVRLRDGQVVMHPEIAAAQGPLEQAVQRIQDDPEIQESGAFVELKRDANNTVWTGVAVHTPTGGCGWAAGGQGRRVQR